MQILAESKQYIVFNEYETVLLRIKESQQQIQIGDFYGNPQMAVISKNEKFCVICGCGIIVYYLQKPFEEYEYHKQTSQWKEWGRVKDNEIWVESIKCVDDKIIEIEKENGEIVEFEVYGNHDIGEKTL